MHVLAEQFTSSPSGWVIMTLCALLVGLTGYVGRRALVTQDRHGQALTEISKSLAVVVATSGNTERTVADSVADIDDLSQAVAVLQSWRTIAEQQLGENRADLKYLMAGRHPNVRSTGS